MKDVRNADGRLICKVDECFPIVEISVKGCITRIRYKPDGTIEITNSKKTA